MLKNQPKISPYEFGRMTGGWREDVRRMKIHFSLYYFNISNPIFYLPWACPELVAEPVEAVEGACRRSLSWVCRRDQLICFIGWLFLSNPMRALLEIGERRHGSPADGAAWNQQMRSRCRRDAERDATSLSNADRDGFCKTVPLLLWLSTTTKIIFFIKKSPSLLHNPKKSSTFAVILWNIYTKVGMKNVVYWIKSRY